MLSLIFSAGVFSQTADVPDTGSPAVTAVAAVETVSPDNVLAGIFETFFALVAFIPIAVQFLRKLLFPNAAGIGIQIFSWVIGLIVTMAGWLLHLGFLDGMNIWAALLYGAGACLAANGVFDTGLITALFDALFKAIGIHKSA